MARHRVLILGGGFGGLYAAKALWITTGLYVILLAISIWGLIVWKRARA